MKDLTLYTAVDSYGCLFMALHPFCVGPQMSYDFRIAVTNRDGTWTFSGAGPDFNDGYGYELKMSEERALEGLFAGEYRFHWERSEFARTGCVRDGVLWQVVDDRLLKGDLIVENLKPQGDIRRTVRERTDAAIFHLTEGAPYMREDGVPCFKRLDGAVVEMA